MFTYCAGTFSTTSQPFSFLEDEIAQGELHLLSPHSRVLFQSTHYAVCLSSALDSPFMFLSSNCLWQAAVALYFHSTVEIEYMSNAAVLNSFGLNISPWDMPVVTVGIPTVHCYPLSLKSSQVSVHLAFCPGCVSPHQLQGYCLESY